MNKGIVVFIVMINSIKIGLSQNVNIYGVTEKYSPNQGIPFYYVNCFSNTQKEVAKIYRESNKYSTSFSVDKPKIISLFFKRIYVEPNDTTEFNFSFLYDDPQKAAEHTINVKAKFPGNYLYYDYVERKISQLYKRSRLDSNNVSGWIKECESSFYELKNEIDSFIIENPVSASFKEYINEELPFINVAIVTRELYNQNIYFKNSSFHKKIADSFSKLMFNNPKLIQSRYYSECLGAYANYHLFINEVVENENPYAIYAKRFKYICDSLVGDAKDLAILFLTRVSVLSNNILNDLVADKVMMTAIAENIQNKEVLTTLNNFINYYSKISIDSIKGLKIENYNGDIMSLGEILNKQTSNKIIDLWASWCKPCIEQAPLVDSIARSEGDLLIIPISIDEDKVAWKKKVVDLKNNKRKSYRFLNNDEIELASKYLKIGAIPRYIFVNKKGEIIVFSASPPTNKQLFIKQLQLLN